MRTAGDIAIGHRPGARAAGFWRRCAAWTLDTALLALPVALFFGEHLARTLAHATVQFAALSDLLAQRMAEVLMTMQPSLEALLALAADPALHRATTALHAGLGRGLLLPVACLVVLSLAWHLLFEGVALRAATPGQRALGLRVEAAGGGRASPGRLLARFFAGGVSWLTLNIGHAIAAVPPRHLALHDVLSGTRVVLATPAPPFPAWAKAWLAVVTGAAVVLPLWATLQAMWMLQAALERALMA